MCPFMCIICLKPLQTRPYLVSNGHAYLFPFVLSDLSLILLIAGNTLTFLVGSKQAFEVSLTDVSQTQLQGKTDVYLEFHVDDTTGANEVAHLYL